MDNGRSAWSQLSVWGIACLSSGFLTLAALPLAAEDAPATEKAAEQAVEKSAEKAEEKTTEKVAAKPDDKSDKPTEKPAEKPEEKPADPVEKPAAPQADVTFLKSETADAAPESADEVAVKDAIKAFAEAFNSHDAKAVAAQFTSLAELENQVGHVTKGNAPIYEVFHKLFTENPKIKLQLEIQSIRFLSPELSIEEGISTMSGGGAEGVEAPPHQDRYTITHIKQEGKWLVASARDWPPPPPTAAQQLQQLAWLVGDWVDENSSTTVHTSYHWSKDNRYLMSRYSVKREGRDPVEGLQRIGWDPQARQLRSWTFDSVGGFSEGLWSRAGDQWIIKLSGVTADGQIRSATNILTRLSDDHATYQSRDRVIGSEVMPDLDPVPIVRKAPEPGIFKK